ncbi:MAG TPA: translocation/assembly module TamB domain-containing protein [Pseudolabrys sp.]|nr:translocation/assembly module TamB domain-containing protein [Pseudolabrys sp.]
MQIKRTTIGIGFAFCLLTAGALVVSTLAGRTADDDKGILSNFLSRVLSTPTSRVSIGLVQGALLSDSTISDIKIADRNGVWLEIDRVQFNWTRSALLFRKLQIDKLQIGTVRYLRPALPNEQPEAVSKEPLLPELPLKVEIKDFGLKELALGAPVLGTAASVSATGAATLGNPAEGLNLRFDARRLDAAGTLAARVELVPDTQRLNLNLSVDEPANGIAAHALNVPGRPPVKLTFEGNGTLDSFNAQLAFAAGDDIGANGTAQIRRIDKERRLTIDMASRIEGLLPSLAAPVFAGTTRLNGNIGFADGGAITISPLTVASQTARLDINGGLTADQIADVAITVRSLPNAGDKTAAGGAEIGRLAFDGTIKGPLMGPTVDATLDARDIATPQGRARTVTAKLNAAPTGDVTNQATRIGFSADAQAAGLAPRDPALARALGDTLSLTVRGNWQDGVADIATARLQTPTAQASFNGRAGNEELRGRLAAEAPDLARFASLAGTSLRGAFKFDADIGGVPKDDRYEAVIDGNVTRFGTGIAAIDGLAGDRVTLKGKVLKLPAGGFGFSDLNLAGAHATARLDGQATVTAANIDARAVIAELRHADNRLSGRAELAGKITGTVERPDANVTITLTDARALGRPISRLAIGLTATDVTGLIDARATLSGSVDNKPAEGALHFAKQQNGVWLLNDVDLRIGSVTAKGGVTLTAEQLASGRLTIDAGNLDDLSPLALTKLAGQLRADATLNAANGGQDIALVATARGVKAGASSLGQLDADLRATDIYRKPVIDGRVSIDRVTVGGEEITQVRLTASGASAASDIALTAQARGFALDARGRLVAADNISLELSRLTATRDKRRIALTQPATLTVRDNGVDIRALMLSLDRGRLSVDGRAGDTYDLTIKAQAVPLSIADVIVPKLGLSGTLDADARVTGTKAAPAGQWSLRVDNLVAPQTRDAGLPPIDVQAKGQLADGRTSVDGAIGAKGAGSIRVNGTVPLAGDGLDLAVTGNVNFGIADRFLAQSGRRVTGAAAIDFKVGGSLQQPRIDGSATVNGAGYTDPLIGIRYTNIAARIVARGDDVRIERFSAQTPNGGAITAQGSINIDPKAGFPGDVRISARRAKLIENDIYSLVANVAVSLSGPLTRDPTIAGTIDVVSLDVTVPERLPSNLSPIPGTVHVGAPPQAAARLAAAARERARASRAPPFNATLDLTITAPSRVFVRGRGIDAELGGDLRLRGRLSDPQTIGAFELRRGRMSIAGTRLDFTEGRIVFTGDLTPDLDFKAQTQAGEVTAIIAVSGAAREPQFTFSSQPDLPQDEVLSRILFSKASGGLSAIQALQLAQVAAQFSGGGGPDVFESVRKSLGVDSLDVSVGSSGNPTVGISRSINRRLSVGVKTGTEANDSGVTVDFDVTRNIRLKGEADANGGGAVGAGVEWEY